MNKPAVDTTSETAARIARLLGRAAAAGAVVTLCYALQALPAPSRAFAVLAIALAVAGAAAVVGALLGFVFGVPRALQGSGDAGKSGSSTEQGSSARAGSAKRQAREAAYGANTSLEQISDWLTKILVGVGLTQLTQVPAAVESYSTYLGRALGGLPGAEVFIGALSLYFVVCGFLASYLWTRLTLGRAFSEADVLTRAEFEQAQETNARALALAQRQLEKGGQEPPEAELAQALGEADDLYRAHIYELAKAARIEGHKKKDARLVQRTVPVFRALIQHRPDTYHQNHGQLGLALIELDPPDLAGCEASLNRAIALRGPWEKSGFLSYELVRALCRIRRSRGEAAEAHKADPESQAQIIRDLQAVVHWPFDQLEPETQDEIRTWLKRHHGKVEGIA
ncbi:hypothetical protein [Ideonella sp.]|uniref:hypothetical protein n=1 Tax=Ideonella sp. TaxID=1929293 RepID=UPI002B493E9D|nr:hypothetical protein [Ideonella sp.]HJV71921.1 hypothetical protein [Ideonella sp.]